MQASVSASPVTLSAPLELVYQDEHLVAINKPAGLLVHRSHLDRHETRFALQMLRDQIGRRVYPVHRLDKPTSGILLFALSPDTARQLSLLFEQRQVHKHYLAVVRGHCPEQGEIDYPLKEQRDRIADARVREDKPAQEAMTRFRRLATVELPVAVDRYPQTRYSLVQLSPRTGRRHQLRRHMKHIGHPIIGDAKHGKGVHNRFMAAQYGCDRLLLACTETKLVHPVHGELMTLRAPLSGSFAELMTTFGWQNSLGA